MYPLPEKMPQHTSDIVIENVELTGVSTPIFETHEIPDKSERNLDLTLPQESKSNQSKRLTYLFNRAYLAHKRSDNKSTELITDIRFLDDKFESQLKIAWKLLLASLFLLASSLLAFFNLELSTLNSFGVLACSITLLVLAIFNSSYRLAIFTKHGRLKVAELFMNLPNKSQFDDFCEQLKTEIKNAQNSLPRGNKRYALEMTEHRRIYESGAIKLDEYSAAKENILKCFSN